PCDLPSFPTRRASDLADNPQYVTLGVAEDLFAAPIERVQEILEMRPIARLPRAPANLLGMIDVRSRAVPVIDLRATLGLPLVAEDRKSTRLNSSHVKI